MKTAIEIITNRIAKIERAIDRLKGSMQTGKECAYNGAKLSRAIYHKEVLEDTLKEIEYENINL